MILFFSMIDELYHQIFSQKTAKQLEVIQEVVLSEASISLGDQYSFLQRKQNGKRKMD